MGQRESRSASKIKEVSGKNKEVNKEVSGKEEIPKVVVGLDFGTTHSGFAFAHRSDLKDIQIFTEYPGAPRSYCKGQTSLLYVPDLREEGCFKLEDWSWNAEDKFIKASKAEWAKFATNFKLLLAEGGGESQGDFPVERLVVDYLHCMFEFIIKHLRDKYGQTFSQREVQWCLTVPAIWNDHAKQKMQLCAEKAGLVRGKFCSNVEASIYPLRLILEPEAASFCCQEQLQGVLSFSEGDRFLVADLGGGTIDIVLHEKESALDKIHRVREVVASSGALGGGTYVDSNFLALLQAKIGCFEAFRKQEPGVVHKILKWWLGPQGKSTFDGTSSKLFEVPRKLSNAWKQYDIDNQLGISEIDDYYEEIKISSDEMRALFDTEINKVIKLIEEKISKSSKSARAITKHMSVKYIFLVGGFSENPYVVKRIKDQFSCALTVVLAPPNPGAAVCRGAVSLGAGTGVVMSRISKKWYGIQTTRNSCPGDPSELVFIDKRGFSKCKNTFYQFVRKGEAVPEHEFVTRAIYPLNADDKFMRLPLINSGSDVEPKYRMDKGCESAAEYIFDINEDLHLGVSREVAVTMCFGKSCIEVFARRVNFGKNREPEKMYEVEFDATSTTLNK